MQDWPLCSQVIVILAGTWRLANSSPQVTQVSVVTMMSARCGVIANESMEEKLREANAYMRFERMYVVVHKL